MGVDHSGIPESVGPNGYEFISFRINNHILILNVIIRIATLNSHMDSNNGMSYRPLGRLAELKAHNENNKRFFGRDITNNLDKRLKKNVSIYEKLPVATKVETRVRSRSLYGSK